MQEQEQGIKGDKWKQLNKKHIARRLTKKREKERKKNQNDKLPKIERKMQMKNRKIMEKRKLDGNYRNRNSERENDRETEK